MSEAMSPSLNRATFALQSRLFVAMKRAGRVIDLVWLQHNPEYARAVLDTADRMNDAEVKEIAQRLRGLLGDYLTPAPARVAMLRPAPVAVAPSPAPAAAPAASAALRPSPASPAVDAAAPAATEEPVALDRHLTSLR